MERRIRLIIQGEDKASSVLAGAAGNANKHMSTIQSMGAKLLTGFLAFKAIGAVMDVATGAVKMVGDALADTAQKGMEFNRQISAIGAIANASSTEMDGLRKLAVDLGRDTVFTSNEAAEAIKELAKQGLEVPTILNGAAAAAVSLASAGELELAPAAEIMARALNSFNLGGEKAAWVADILTGAANTSATSVENVGAAMKFASSNMNSLTNESYTSEAAFVDLATAIAAMSNMGIDASMAGTGLSRILEGLTPNSEKAAAMMKEMGVTFFDAKGDFIGLKAALDVLHGGLAKLTDEEQATQIEKIFGVRGKNAVQALMNAIYQTGEDWDKYRADVTEAGLATDTAAKKLDNLAGAWEFMRGSLESLQLTVWTKEVEDALTPVIERVSKMFSTLATAAENPAFKNAIEAIASSLSTTLLGAIDIIEPRILGFMDALGKPETVTAIDALGRSFGNLFAAIMGEDKPMEPGKGLDGIRGFTDYMGSDAATTAQTHAVDLATAIDGVAEAVNKWAGFIRDSRQDFEDFKKFWESPPEDKWSTVLDTGKREAGEFADEVRDAYKRATDYGIELGVNAKPYIDQWVKTLHDGAVDGGRALADGMGTWNGATAASWAVFALSNVLKAVGMLSDIAAKISEFDPGTAMATWGAKMLVGWTTATADVIGAVITWGAEMYNTIASIDLYGAAFSLGASVVSGLLAGMTGGGGGSSGMGGTGGGGAYGAIGRAAGNLANAAINAWKGKTQTHSPSLVFKALGENVVQGLLVGFENMTPELLQRVEDIAQMVQDVFRTVSEGVPALDALKGYEQGLTRDTVVLFANDVAGVVETLQAVTAKFSKDGVKAAAEWATSASTVLGLISNGVDALVKLRDVSTAGLTRDMVLQFAYDVYGVVETLQAVTASFSKDGVKAAAEWAESAGTVVGIISGGIDALVKLRDTSTAGLMRSSVTDFAENLAVVVQIMQDTTYQFTNEGVAAAAEFADGAGRIIAPIVGAIEAFTKLSDYKGVAGWMFDMLGADLRLAVDKMVDISRKFEAEGVEAAAVFADAVGRILAPIGAAIETFTKINDYKGVAPAAVKLLADDIMGTIGHIIAITKYADTEGAESAAKFADASGRIFAGMKSGIETIASINEGNALDSQKAAEFFAGLTSILASASVVAQQQGANTGFTFVTSVQDTLLKLQNQFIGFWSQYVDSVIALALEPGYVKMREQAYRSGESAGYAWSQGFESSARVHFPGYSTGGTGESRTGEGLKGGGPGSSAPPVNYGTFSTVTVNLNGLSTQETVNRVNSAVQRGTGARTTIGNTYGI